MLSSVGIMSIKLKQKATSLMENFEFQQNVKLPANQKNLKVSHCLVGQLDTNLSPI